MKLCVRRIAVCLFAAGALVGTAVGFAFAAESAPKTKNCGGAPAKDGDPRTNNANCKKCISGCNFKDDGYKVCQDDGTGCTLQKFPDVKQCDGDLWTKKDCTGTMSGTCQAARHYCK